MELNLERRELQLEEKKLILEIAIRVNDLRPELAFLKNKTKCFWLLLYDEVWSLKSWSHHEVIMKSRWRIWGWKMKIECPRALCAGRTDRHTKWLGSCRNQKEWIIFCNASRDETKQLSLSPSRARAASQEDSGNGTSCSSGSGNEVTIPGAINELLLISEDFYNWGWAFK